MSDEMWRTEIGETNAKRRRRDWALTPEDRLAIADELSRSAWEHLQSNPAAYLAFLKRQHRRRNADSERRREIVYRGKVGS